MRTAITIFTIIGATILSTGLYGLYSSSSTKPIYSVSADKFLWTSNANGEITQWSLSDMKIVRSLMDNNMKDLISGLDVSPDKQTLAV